MQDKASSQKPRPEKTIGAHWLRGGQTVAHTWDMIFELIKKFAIGMVLWGILVINVVNARAPDLEQTYGGQAVIVWIYRTIGKPLPDKLTVKSPEGIDNVVTVQQFDTLPYIKPAVDDYNRLLFGGFIMWMLGNVAVACFLSIWFIRSGAEKIEDHEIRGQKITSLRILLRLIYDYNCRELIKQNFTTMTRLGFHQTKNAKTTTVGQAFHHGILYLGTLISDLLGWLTDVTTCALQLVKSVVAPQMDVHDGVAYAGGAMAVQVASQPNNAANDPARTQQQSDDHDDSLRLSSRTFEQADAPAVRRPFAGQKVLTPVKRGYFARLGRSWNCAKKEFDERYDARFGNMRRMRYFETIQPNAKNDFLAYLKHEPDAIYRILQSDEWKYQRRDPFHQKCVEAVAELASEKGLTFYKRPSDFLAPKIIGIPYPMDAEREHTLVVGGTGSGKTVAINSLIDSLKIRKDKAFIYDPEGDFIKVHYREGIDKILNPFDLRSVAWSPFNDMHSLTDWQSAAEDLFSDDSSEPYWTMVPRAIYAQTGHVLTLFYAKYFQRKPTVKEFLQVLNGPHEVIYKLIANTSAGRQLGETVGGRTESLRSVIANITGMLEHLVAANDSFSVKEWVNNATDDSMLFITAPDDIAASVKPLLSHWASLATTALLARSEEQSKIPTWIILDEFPTLKIEALAKAPARLRKFNGRMVIGIQQFSQLESNYGKEDANTIIGQMSNKLILKVIDPTTKEYFSKLIGDREVRRKDESVSFGANNIRDGVSITPKDSVERIVMPEELSSLPKMHGYIHFSPGKDAEAFPFVPVKFDYIDRKIISERCVRVTKVESIDDYLPKLTEQITLQGLMDKNGVLPKPTASAQPRAAQQKPTQENAEGANVIIYDETGSAGLKVRTVEDEERERAPLPGDTPDALPGHKYTLETSYEDIKGLDSKLVMTDAEMAKVNDRAADALNRQEMLASGDINTFFNAVLGNAQQEGPAVAPASTDFVDRTVSTDEAPPLDFDMR